ncbi:MAG: TonB-dependent receptor plug domain-containing protein [Spirosomataceae bacterium]
MYATQTVKPTELTEARDPNNIINSLSGKIANAVITQGSGGPGSGSRIVLRGNRSIQGSNNALIVVDGVPLNNNISSTAGSDFGFVQGSDGASNINPDDIESVTVLRERRQPPFTVAKQEMGCWSSPQKKADLTKSECLSILEFRWNRPLLYPFSKTHMAKAMAANSRLLRARAGEKK